MGSSFQLRILKALAQAIKNWQSPEERASLAAQARDYESKVAPITDNYHLTLPIHEEGFKIEKVMLVFGTRPEAIKMCPLVNELKQHNTIETVVY